MSEDLNALIEKIQAEGVEIAQAKAREIEAQARKEADAIIAKAKQDAQAILSKARAEAARTEESTMSLLKQAGRDLLINLKKEVNAALERIVNMRVKEALTADEASRLIISFIKDAPKDARQDIVVSLEKGFLNELKEDVKKGVTLKASDDISAGFTISVDAGKSHFDFTDKALTEYIINHLKPKLKEILK